MFASLERMGADLRLRGYAAATQTIYVRHAREFLEYIKRSPEEVTAEDVRRYQVYVTDQKEVSTSTFNQIAAALRFLYRVSIERDWAGVRITYRKKRRRLPEVLSQREVRALFDCTTNLKHRALMMTMYGAGLRVSETVRLRVSDIDSDRMVIRIEKGKGGKDRYVMLSKNLLHALRAYWKVYRPRPWLFPGYETRPMTTKGVRSAFAKAKERARIDKPVTPHSLRHSFATHLLEDGVRISVVQRLLGHRSLRSTEIYAHVAEGYLARTRSPLDTLT